MGVVQVCDGVGQNKKIGFLLAKLNKLNLPITVTLTLTEKLIDCLY